MITHDVPNLQSAIYQRQTVARSMPTWFEVTPKHAGVFREGAKPVFLRIKMGKPGKNKARMACAERKTRPLRKETSPMADDNAYTKPELREKLKEEIKEGDKGGKPGRWSARKSQLLVHEYEQAEGGYVSDTRTPAQEHLEEWERQDWRTEDGKPAQRGDKTARSLPAQAWEALTPAQRKATNAKKLNASAEQQYVENTPAAKAAARHAEEAARPTQENGERNAKSSAMNTPILSLQIGLPQAHTSDIKDGQAREWTSSIGKAPVLGRVALGATHLAGDGQADLKHHGGADKAVCCYPAAHYPVWRALLGRDETSFPPGAFGENFTVGGLAEDSVCIGDIYSAGEALVQVSQPRMPCWKMGRRWNRLELAAEMIARGQTGWYLRVLEPGEVGAGDLLTLRERPLPQWTVARINQAMYVDKADGGLAYELGRLPLLAEAWRSPFRRRAGLIAYQSRRREASQAGQASD